MFRSPGGRLFVAFFLSSFAGASLAYGGVSQTSLDCAVNLRRLGGAAAPAKRAPVKPPARKALVPQLRDGAREDLILDVHDGLARISNPLIRVAWSDERQSYWPPQVPFEADAFVAEQIARGHDLDARDQFGRTPLMHAAAASDNDLYFALLRAGARTDFVD